MFYEYIDKLEISLNNKSSLFEECTINNILKINNSKIPLKLLAKEALEDNIINFEQISYRIFQHKKNKSFNIQYSNQIEEIYLALERLKPHF